MFVDGSNEEEYDELGYQYESSGMFGTGLGGLLRGVGFIIGATFSAYESCYGDGFLLAVPYVNIFEAGTG